VIPQNGDADESLGCKILKFAEDTCKIFRDITEDIVSLQVVVVPLASLWAKSGGTISAFPFSVFSISIPLPLSLPFILPQIYLENLRSAVVA